MVKFKAKDGEPVQPAGIGRRQRISVAVLVGVDASVEAGGVSGEPAGGFEVVVAVVAVDQVGSAGRLRQTDDSEIPGNRPLVKRVRTSSRSLKVRQGNLFLAPIRTRLENP